MEKYIFSKVYDKLFAMYAIKNEEMDRAFTDKTQLIQKYSTPKEAMEYLGINPKFMIIDG